VRFVGIFFCYKLLSLVSGKRKENPLLYELNTTVRYTRCIISC